MTDAASIPGPASGGDAGGFEVPGWPAVPGQGWLSDEDVLALLDGLGVPGTHDPAEAQDAIAEAEWQARFADDDHYPSGSSARQDNLPGSSGGGGDLCGADGYPVSPVLVAGYLPAGPGLAAVLARDPAAGASDFDLAGLAAGYRKLAAWAQARELDAAAEIAARRAAASPRIGTDETGRPASLPPEAAAEVALELVMSQYGASAWTSLGCRLRYDLPGTGAALAAGTIDLGRARIIAEATTGLGRGHAAAVEARVLPRAAAQTTGQLRAAARRAVLAVDPDGADQRRRDTERHARVSLYPGEEGTATLAGSCLPGVQAAAAMARITAMARALKSSGARGGLDLLRAHVFIGLLLGTLPLIPPPPPGDGAPPGPGTPPGPGSVHDNPPSPPAGADGPGSQSDGGPQHDQPPAGDGPGGQSDGGPRDGRPDGDARPHGEDDLPGWWPDIPPPTDTDSPPDDDSPPGDGGPPGPARALAGQHGGTYDDDEDWPQLPPPDWPPLPARLPAPPAAAPTQDDAAQAPARPGATGLLDVLIPWTALAGHSREPAVLGRIGPVSSWQARELLALATRGPATHWHVIVTDDHGRAISACRARPPRQAAAGDTDPHSTGTVGRITITIRAADLGTPAAAPGPASPLTVQQIAPTVLEAADRALDRARRDIRAAAGACAHTMASGAYRPPPRIREHIAARDRTCRFGPCGQPAWRADLDHTLPWHTGGLTCPCNLGGFCRTHHQIKQLPGWLVQQPQPGSFRWTTPAGRSYLVQPDLYPV